MTPPTSKRFCLTCMKVKTFRYDPVLMHSRCVECQCGAACRPELAKMIIKHVKDSQKDFPSNKKTVTKHQLENKISCQKKVINQLLEQNEKLKNEVEELKCKEQ